MGNHFDDRALHARVKAQNALMRFGYVERAVSDSYQGLATLLGIKISFTVPLKSVMTEEHCRLCELLAGPHGYAVYRMLLARKEAA